MPVSVRADVETSVFLDQEHEPRRLAGKQALHPHHELGPPFLLAAQGARRLSGAKILRARRQALLPRRCYYSCASARFSGMKSTGCAPHPIQVHELRVARRRGEDRGFGARSMSASEDGCPCHAMSRDIRRRSAAAGSAVPRARPDRRQQRPALPLDASADERATPIAAELDLAAAR